MDIYKGCFFFGMGLGYFKLGDILIIKVFGFFYVDFWDKLMELMDVCNVSLIF